MVPNGSSLITNNPKSKSAGLQFARITLFVIALLFISLPMASAGSGVDINAETFPDAAFRAIVSADYSDGSGHVDMSVTSITVNSQSIASLAGIEYFPALTDLACNNNQLTALDVSQNTVLAHAYPHCHHE